MFGSAILDAAIGVIFGFLAISLFTSAIVEAINSFLKTRAVNLRGAVKELVNDPGFGGLALQLYQHALISPFGPGKPPEGASQAVVAAATDVYRKPKSLPSYIDKAQFARAFLDVTKLTPHLSDVTKAIAAADKAANAINAVPPAPQQLADAFSALKAEITNIPSVQIQTFLNGAVDRAHGDIDKVEKQVADWFDASMDRLSGKFKRDTQAWTFGIALVLAIVVNIDSIHIGRQIWAHPEFARGVALSNLDKVDIKVEEDALGKITNWLGDDFPIGWPAGAPLEVLDIPSAAQDAQPNAAVRAPRLMYLSEFGSALLGWLITAAAALFGAPFWFDTLQSLVRLKGSGPSPEEKADKTAASA